MPDFQTLLIYIIPLLFAITIPQAANAWVASKLGDHTARMLGKVTLNPVKHIDPVGTILVPLLLLISNFSFIFGWAKQIPFNTRSLRSQRSGIILIALAGPGSNFLLAIVWLIIANFAPSGTVLLKMTAFGIYINILLAIFNLIPIPPLNGSRVVSELLPGPLSYKYNQIEQYGFFIVLGLMFFGAFKYILLIVFLVLDFLSIFSQINVVQFVINNVFS